MRKCCVHQQNGLRHLRPRPNLIDMPLILAIATGRGLTVSPATIGIVHRNQNAEDQSTVTSFGRVILVRGSLARVGLLRNEQMGVSEVRATVGRFVSIRCVNSTIVAMITEVSCEDLPSNGDYIASASVDLLGEILGGPDPTQVPARRHQLSDYRRYRRPDHQSGASHGLRAQRLGSDRHRHSAAGPIRHGLCRCRGNALQALRRARLDRRRQIDRRVAAAERNPQVATESADIPARRSQRIRPLLR